MTAILIETCPACNATWALPRGRCPECGAPGPLRVPSSGRGTIFAATLVHRAPDEAFRALVPYRIALIDLEEGPRIMGHLTGDAAIGDRVAGAVREVAGRPIPVFDPDTP